MHSGRVILTRRSVLPYLLSCDTHSLDTFVWTKVRLGPYLRLIGFMIYGSKYKMGLNKWGMVQNPKNHQRAFRANGKGQIANVKVHYDHLFKGKKTCIIPTTIIQ